MVLKRQGRSEQALIEVWREGDRVLIGVPSADVSARSNTDSGGPDDEPYPYRHSVEDWGRVLVGGLRTDTKPSASEPTDAERDEAEMFAMSEDEWLAADLLALRRQAVDLARSVDETLAYVAEKCAAIAKD